MRLGKTTPILRIFDEAFARDFYVDFLEFKVDFEHRFEENLPLYMGISKDGCRIHLSGHHGDACPGSAVRIETTGVDEYQQKLIAKNYKYYRPGVGDTPWGTREMCVEDPFGNRIIFAEAK